MNSIGELKGYLSQIESNLDNKVMSLIVALREELEANTALLNAGVQGTGNENLQSALAGMGEVTQISEEMITKVLGIREYVRTYNAQL